MKKLFIAVMAVAAMASCAQEEVILNNNKAIEFGDAFVNNATKAIYEGTKKVDSFLVWGTVKGDGDAVALYEGATVSRGDKNYNEAWSCTVTRFWTPDCDYNFYAVVDANNVIATNGVPSTIEYTAVANGDQDLLYGATSKTTKTGLAQPADGSLVKFTMQHLLSKISFKFTNPESNGDYSYNVTAVTVSGAFASGTYTFANTAAANANNGTWVGTGTTATPLSFGAVAGTLAKGAIGTAANSCLIIPGEPELTINVTTETIFNGAKLETKTHTLTVNKTAEDTNVTFAKNTHYNFAVTLPAPGVAIALTIGTVSGFGDGTPDTPIH